MKDLIFDTGLVTYNINGKCEFSFNPTDSAFVEKLFNAFDILDKKQDAYKAVFADADSFETVDADADAMQSYLDENGYAAQSIDETMLAKDASGNELGYAFTVTTSEGYGGDIQITVGIMSDGTVNGISFLSISETAGLGMRAKEPSFYNQFAGQQAEKFYVSKDGGDGQPIDALSGVTITSRAVTGAVNTALGYYQTALGGSGNE
mgnify:CR=1 FL=1